MKNMKRPNQIVSNNSRGVQVPPIRDSMNTTNETYTDPEALLQARVLKILKPCRG